MVSAILRNAFPCAFLIASILFPAANPSPLLANRAQAKYSAADLLDSYDYVVVGGGTSGLVVGSRLSEDPSSENSHVHRAGSSVSLTRGTTETVLVIEIGYIADESCIWMPVNTIAGGNSDCVKHRFNSKSTVHATILQH